MNPLDFSVARNLLREYRLCISEPDDADTRAIACEAEIRLRQLDWVYQRVRRLQDEQVATIRLMAEGASGEFEPPRDLADRERDQAEEIGVLTEAFYYFAWRFRQVIRPLPGLSRYDPRGIRDVRNQLIEHPPEHGAKLSHTRMTSSDTGPQLRVSRNADTRHYPVDRGLYHNAAELLNELMTRLQRLEGQRQDPSTATAS